MSQNRNNEAGYYGPGPGVQNYYFGHEQIGIENRPANRPANLSANRPVNLSANQGKFIVREFGGNQYVIPFDLFNMRTSTVRDLKKEVCNELNRVKGILYEPRFLTLFVPGASSNNPIILADNLQLAQIPNFNPSGENEINMLYEKNPFKIDTHPFYRNVVDFFIYSDNTGIVLQEDSSKYLSVLSFNKIGYNLDKLFEFKYIQQNLSGYHLFSSPDRKYIIIYNDYDSDLYVIDRDLCVINRDMNSSKIVKPHRNIIKSIISNVICSNDKIFFVVSEGIEYQAGIRTIYYVKWFHLNDSELNPNRIDIQIIGRAITRCSIHIHNDHLYIYYMSLTANDTSKYLIKMDLNGENQITTPFPKYTMITKKKVMYYEPKILKCMTVQDGDHEYDVVCMVELFTLINNVSNSSAASNDNRIKRLAIYSDRMELLGSHIFTPADQVDTYNTTFFMENGDVYYMRHDEPNIHIMYIGTNMEAIRDVRDDISGDISGGSRKRTLRRKKNKRRTRKN